MILVTSVGLTFSNKYKLAKKGTLIKRIQSPGRGGAVDQQTITQG